MAGQHITVAAEQINRIVTLHHQQWQTGWGQQTFLLRSRATPDNFFRVQYNPRRADRPQGADAPRRHGSARCVLCTGARRAGSGDDMRIALADGREVRIGANPFPLGPGHLLMRAVGHAAHGWLRTRYNASVGAFSAVLAAMVKLQVGLPDFIIWYSSPGAGATQPAHLHWHLMQRPAGFHWPLEQAVRRMLPGKNEADPTRSVEYPVAFRHFSGSAEAIQQACVAWFKDWLEEQWHRATMLACNLITTNTSDGAIGVFVVPRLSTSETVPGIAGRIAGYELLGEIVLSAPTELRSLQDGDFDYEHIARCLGKVETPGLRAGEGISRRVRRGDEMNLTTPPSSPSEEI